MASVTDSAHEGKKKSDEAPETTTSRLGKELHADSSGAILSTVPAGSAGVPSSFQHSKSPDTDERDETSWPEASAAAGSSGRSVNEISAADVLLERDALKVENAQLRSVVEEYGKLRRALRDVLTIGHDVEVGPDKIVEAVQNLKYQTSGQRRPMLYAYALDCEAEVTLTSTCDPGASNDVNRRRFVGKVVKIGRADTRGKPEEQPVVRIIEEVNRLRPEDETKKQRPFYLIDKPFAETFRSQRRNGFSEVAEAAKGCERIMFLIPELTGFETLALNTFARIGIAEGMTAKKWHEKMGCSHVGFTELVVVPEIAFAKIRKWWVKVVDEWKNRPVTPRELREILMQHYVGALPCNDAVETIPGCGPFKACLKLPNANEVDEYEIKAKASPFYVKRKKPRTPARESKQNKVNI